MDCTIGSACTHTDTQALIAGVLHGWEFHSFYLPVPFRLRRAPLEHTTRVRDSRSTFRPSEVDTRLESPNIATTSNAGLQNNQSEGGGTAPHGIHASLGALGWSAGCVEEFVVPSGCFARAPEESLRMLKKSGRPSPYALKERLEIVV